MMLDRIELGFVDGDVTIEAIHPLIHDKSADVRTASYETLGLWLARKKAYYGQEHEGYFQSALSLRSWASSYIYLAESKAEKKQYDEAFQLLDIAKRQAPELEYIACMEKLWIIKMGEPIAPETGDPTTGADGLNE